MDIVHGGLATSVQRFVTPGIAFSRGHATTDSASTQPVRKDIRLWSRPFPPWVLGILPNSVVQRVSVSSSIPRCCRSLMSSLGVILGELSKRDMTNVLIEGGQSLLGNVFDEGLVDDVHCFIAPKIVGGRRICSRSFGK